jgi:DNA repair exonuclease SbcCD ATPase subunit
MNETTNAYLEAARAYADGVRVLFAPSGQPTGERGGRGPGSPKDLENQAEKLSPLSEELARATEAQLADADASVRAEASIRLLAKAVTDLEISEHLLHAAEDEESEVPWRGGEGTERSRSGIGTIEEHLKLLEGKTEPISKTVERGRTAPATIVAAREELANAIEDALTLISERASETGQSSLKGLVGLGGAELAKAAGVVGIGIAQALGQAEKVTRLYNLFRDFALKAYDAVINLLGQKLADTAAKQVIEWLDEFKGGKKFDELLEKLYETKQTQAELKQLAENSQADLQRFVASIEAVDGLNEAYRRQIELVKKLLRAIDFIKLVPATALPIGKVLLAAVYITAGGYVVIAGADYVDARRLTRLNRVPGVNQVVQAKLA